jgi:hypothetical protein
VVTCNREIFSGFFFAGHPTDGCDATMSAPARYVEFWGPSTWRAMHSIAYTAPERPSIEEQRQFVDFFRLLGDVLPCPSCRVHYQKYMSEHPIDASSREALVQWVYDLHDSVNKRKGKESPSRAAVDAFYSNWDRARQLKYSASSHAERALGSPRMEDAAAEEMRWDAAAAAVAVAAVAVAGAIWYARRRRDE